MVSELSRNLLAWADAARERGQPAQADLMARAAATIQARYSDRPLAAALVDLVRARGSALSEEQGFALLATAEAIRIPGSDSQTRRRLVRQLRAWAGEVGRDGQIGPAALLTRGAAAVAEHETDPTLASELESYAAQRDDDAMARSLWALAQALRIAADR